MASFSPSHVKLNVVFMVLLSLCSNSAFSDEKSRPDSHAPIGVMAEHAHKQGEFMFSYRFMNMRMEDNGDGSDTLETQQILAGGNNEGSYMVAPQEMSMDMHMLGLMYAPSDSLTWMFMLPYIELNMKHLISAMHPQNPRESFTTESDGIGDIKVRALLSLERSEKHSTFLGVGVSLPTGSIDEKDKLLSRPDLGKTQLPFPMQLGSGTLDILPSFTYTRTLEKRSWGSQASAVIRTDKNHHGYSLGNRLQLQAWHAWVVNHELSASLRLALEEWNNIDGDDRQRELPQTMTMNSITLGTVPTVDPGLQAGQSAHLGLGLNGIYGQGEHRLAIEVLNPLYQSLDGPQMQKNLMFVAGYQKAF